MQALIKFLIKNIFYGEYSTMLTPWLTSALESLGFYPITVLKDSGYYILELPGSFTAAEVEDFRSVLSETVPDNINVMLVQLPSPIKVYELGGRNE